MTTPPRDATVMPERAAQAPDTDREAHATQPPHPSQGPDDKPATNRPPALDPIIHVPVRLRIMATLMQVGADNVITFARLQDVLGLTAGNLLTHLRKLEDAHYVSTSKLGKTTSVGITAVGAEAFTRYKAALEALLA